MYRIGQSTDIHQLVSGRKLILGGVEIKHEKGLLGHSDADALLHAIAESILGALALGDLGKHFPDNDPTYKGTDHTRENVPLIIYSKSLRKPKNLGLLESYAVIGATIADNFNINNPGIGNSILKEIK